MCMMSQNRPHSEQLAVLVVGPDMFRPPKEGVEQVLSQERLCPPLLCKKGGEDPPVKRRENALVHDVVRGGPGSTMMTLVVSLHIHSNLLSPAIHGPV